MEQLREDLTEQKLGSLRAEARYWEWKDVKNNQLTQYKEMLKVAADMKADHYVSEALNGLLTNLKNGARFFWGEIPSVVSMLDGLPAQYQFEAQQVRELLKSTPRD